MSPSSLASLSLSSYPAPPHPHSFPHDALPISSLLASYALGTTAANARALDSTEERIQDYRREQRILSDNSISGQSVQRGTLPPDTRPYLAPDWPTLAENKIGRASCRE